MWGVWESQGHGGNNNSAEARKMHYLGKGSWQVDATWMNPLEFFGMFENLKEVQCI